MPSSILRRIWIVSFPASNTGYFIMVHFLYVVVERSDSSKECLEFWACTKSFKVNTTAQGNYLLNTNQKISFSSTVIESGNFSIQERSEVATTSTANRSVPLTLTLLPPLTLEERLNNFVNSWLNPIGGLWTLLVGIAAVIAPLVIRIYKSKKKNDLLQDTNKNTTSDNNVTRSTKRSPLWRQIFFISSKSFLTVLLLCRFH